ncbi:MAG: CCR4-NOT core DEDD RNase subunit [Ramalina farinacea]|uniref:poly(A)-specific ribonuclease n=1 Tax=Ramalina farinacea TaxID=258253 RepID=A0AA43QTZ5_9LECA|nr:CCR4-NOT core DEDD RNase subunit [Ramalina farinacea]
MKASSRFGAHTPSNNYAHNQSSLPHRVPQHQTSNSTGLPPPAYNNPFAPTANPFSTTNSSLSGGFGPTNGFNPASGTGLGSREALEGFVYGAQLQQQSQQKAQMRRSKGGSKGGGDSRIRDVWASNLDEEMDLLEQLIEKYPYVSMDTEFPGIVARPMGQFTSKADYHYQCLRCNVDLLKIIQMGISIFDEEGNSPPSNLADIPGIDLPSQSSRSCPTTWQFNFKFSFEEDMYNSTSIDFIQDCGVDLKRCETEGIDPEKIGSRLVTSGLACFDDVQWMTFHSGYDFAYMLKLMNRNELPEDEAEYRKLMKLYFPSIYDIKFMVQHAQRHQTINDQPLTPEAATILNALPGGKGGLQSLAEELHVRRVGPAHCAGSDALLTGKVFFEVKSKIFGGHIDPDKYLNEVWGLNKSGASSMFSPSNTFSSVTDSTPNLNGATIYQPANAMPPPSTPAPSHAGTNSTTPQQQQQQQQQQQTPRESSGNIGGTGSLTPGGGGGVFGAFRGFGSKG